MQVFGLIGFPLTHSFSKKYFGEKFVKLGLTKSCRYENFELDSITSIISLLENNQEIAGLNVTIPYKEKIIPFLTEMDITSQEIGAVNTIKIVRDANGKPVHLTGYNTDVIGFNKSLSPLLKPFHNNALILGTGGASKAVAFVLNSINIPFKLVSRNPIDSELGYIDLNEEILKKYPIIINTTPLGTYPDIANCPPIPYELLGSENLLFDLVYNPAVTEFMKRGLQSGAAVSNGYEMLVEQAEASWEIWNS